MTIGLLPVLTGGLIYFLFRTDSLRMFNWLEYIGLTDAVRSLRAAAGAAVPGWIKFNLPDALWIFSLTYLTLWLWNFKIDRQSICWILLAPAIGLLSEIGQLFKIFPGTFDTIDLIFLFTGTFIPFFFLSNLKPTKHNTT